MVAHVETTFIERLNTVLFAGARPCPKHIPFRPD
jgi:hypothetical protein